MAKSSKHTSRVGRTAVPKPVEPGVVSTKGRQAVLLAVSGSSPAILTETVWALAHEVPGLIPEQVVVITTLSGARALDGQLLSPRPDWHGLSVWQSLRRVLLGPSYVHDTRLTLAAPVIVGVSDPSVGTIRHLEDIRTPEDNAAAAETILTAVRRFSTDPDTRILGLLSGGRKTMGALLHSALSLAGRAEDRLLHVLVNEPFDHPRLTPTFFFPGQPDAAEHRLAGDEQPAVPHHSARIELADVPLVALGELVFNRTGKAPATFASFTRAAQATLAQATLDTCPLQVGYSPGRRQITVNQYMVTLPEGRASGFFHHLVLDALGGEELADRLRLEERWSKNDVKYLRQDGGYSHFSQDDISNAQNIVRRALLEQAKIPDTLINRLFPLRAPIGLSRDGVTPRLLD